jgi:hypothetical protein
MQEAEEIDLDNDDMDTSSDVQEEPVSKHPRFIPAPVPIRIIHHDARKFCICLKDNTPISNNAAGFYLRFPLVDIKKLCVSDRVTVTLADTFTKKYPYLTLFSKINAKLVEGDMLDLEIRPTPAMRHIAYQLLPKDTIVAWCFVNEFHDKKIGDRHTLLDPNATAPGVANATATRSNKGRIIYSNLIPNTSLEDVSTEFSSQPSINLSPIVKNKKDCCNHSNFQVDKGVPPPKGSYLNRPPNPKHTTLHELASDEVLSKIPVNEEMLNDEQRAKLISLLKEYRQVYEKPQKYGNLKVEPICLKIKPDAVLNVSKCVVIVVKWRTELKTKLKSCVKMAS